MWSEDGEGMKITLKPEEARDILYGDSLDYEVQSDTVTGNGRWSINHKLILKHNTSNKYYRVNYSIGATENQDERPWEYGKEVVLTEVEPFEKTVTDYRDVLE